jgi:hypothetical protein
MNLKQALKKKNKLTGNLKTALNRMIENNSYFDGGKVSYDAVEMLKKATDISEELAELKSKIQLANWPVSHLIYEMGELKNLISNLNKMNCDEGLEYNFRNDNVLKRYAVINKVKRDELIEQMETRIEEINDELDRFNAVTEI